jgi:hypothetical protein
LNLARLSPAQGVSSIALAGSWRKLSLMKARSIFQGITLLVLAGSMADAQTTSRQRYVTTATTEDQYVEKYVYVTGSNIPRKVKVRRWGTNTPDNVAIYSHRDIKNSGRVTTEDALKTLDSSISIRRR